MMANTISW